MTSVYTVEDVPLMRNTRFEGILLSTDRIIPPYSCGIGITLLLTNCMLVLRTRILQDMNSIVSDSVELIVGQYK